MSEEILFELLWRREEAAKRSREELARRKREEYHRENEERRRLEEEYRCREEEEWRRREEMRRRQEEERQHRVDEHLTVFKQEEEARTRQALIDMAGKYRPTPRPEKQESVKEQALTPKSEAELSAECRRFFWRLQNLNSSAAVKHESLMKEVESGTDSKRLSLILDDLKLSYGRELTLAARDRCLRQELAEILAACEAGTHPEDLQSRLRTLLNAPQLTEEDVLAARREFNDLVAIKARRGILENMAATAGKILAEMGYHVMDAEGLTLDHIHYLATPNPDCRIQCRINSRSGRVAFKQMRVATGYAEAAAPFSDYQKALELETGKKWCQAFDRMLERLNDTGYPIETIFRREAGQGDLPVVTDDRRAERRQTTALTAKAREQ